MMQTSITTMMKMLAIQYSPTFIILISYEETLKPLKWIYQIESSMLCGSRFH